MQGGPLAKMSGVDARCFVCTDAERYALCLRFRSHVSPGRAGNALAKDVACS
jgi:hypothetical protein